MITINIPTNLYLTPKNLNFLLSDFRKAFESDDEQVDLNFAKLNWLPGELSPLIFGLISKLTERRKIVSISNVPAKHREFFQRNGLFSELGLTEKMKDVKHTTIETKKIDVSDVEGVNDYVDNTLEKHISTFVNKKNPINDIKEAIFELIDNIGTHANEKYAYIGGQFYPNKKRISFVIVDIGLTIPTNIEDYQMEEMINSFEQDWQIIDWATKRMNTTKNTQGNLTPGGLGLYTISEALKYSGELTIVSRAGFWKQFQGAALQRESLVTPFPGTLIQITFIIDEDNENGGEFQQALSF